ncbi:MAG: hypothetical protein D6785_05790, partial [Planctomycetota bacterium]
MNIFSFLFPIHFFKKPEEVPYGEIILFPSLHQKRCCGIVGILDFGRKYETKDIQSAFSPAKIFDIS